MSADWDIPDLTCLVSTMRLASHSASVNVVTGGKSKLASLCCHGNDPSFEPREIHLISLFSSKRYRVSAVAVSANWHNFVPLRGSYLVSSRDLCDPVALNKPVDFRPCAGPYKKKLSRTLRWFTSMFYTVFFRSYPCLALTTKWNVQPCTSPCVAGLLDFEPAVQWHTHYAAR
jgi:hypothetical protein